MTELADLLPSERPDFVAFRRGRVLSISGRVVTVDLGTLEVTVPAADSCYPVPGQTVLLSVEGSTMTAIASIGGVNRQPTVKVTESTATTVTGLVNGSLRQVTKAGEFTVAVGNELPLYWAADGSEVWAGGRAGVPYVPPPPVDGGGGGGGGAGGGGGGSAPTSYTTTYAASASGFRSLTQGSQSGSLALGPGRTGYFSYGNNRFNELNGKTILSARINLSRLLGSGAVTLQVFKGSLQPSSINVTPGGWTDLPLTRVNDLRQGIGVTEMRITGSGTLQGIPAGAIQVSWR